ncbi:oligoribonuclease [Candidatus Saccharibacteria bacterium]|nr:MAG: oligoribonuclease [Candidatus Saccharibacteria bacterium]PID98945.1 MAG: oligoribonuclease [Candidatus Saccharibacteria bacterium]
MTEVDKKAVPTRLLWVDLEMTGLDAEQDVILEVAAEVTDFELNTLETYEAMVRQPSKLVTERMQKNAWWQSYPANRDEFIRKTSDRHVAKSLREVESELIALVERQFGSEPAVLAGNSIHNDRKFIARWWPKLDLKLHYRMLDVSAWKVYMQGRYGVNYEKADVHRAHDDIQASIAELQHYLAWFKGECERL